MKSKVFDQKLVKLLRQKRFEIATVDMTLTMVRYRRTMLASLCHKSRPLQIGPTLKAAERDGCNPPPQSKNVPWLLKISVCDTTNYQNICFHGIC